MHVNEPGKSFNMLLWGKNMLDFILLSLCFPLRGWQRTWALLQGGKPRGGGPGHARGLPEPQMPDLLHHLGGWLERGRTAWHIVEAQENEFSLLSPFNNLSKLQEAERLFYTRWHWTDCDLELGPSTTRFMSSLGKEVTIDRDPGNNGRSKGCWEGTEPTSFGSQAGEGQGLYPF